MKIRALILTIFLAPLAWVFGAPTPVTQVMEFKVADARQEGTGILLPDRTKNGYDLSFPTGMSVESDPFIAGGHALVWSGSTNWVSASMRCVEMPNLVFSFNVKPYSNSLKTCDIICVNNAWAFRYDANRKKFLFWVYPNVESFTGKAPRMDLELPAKVGEWNQISASITSDKVEFRVNDQTAVFGAATLGLKLVPIRNSSVLVFRPDKDAKFAGSIGDIAIGYKEAAP